MHRKGVFCLFLPTDPDSPEIIISKCEQTPEAAQRLRSAAARRTVFARVVFLPFSPPPSPFLPSFLAADGHAIRFRKHILLSGKHVAYALFVLYSARFCASGGGGVAHNQLRQQVSISSFFDRTRPAHTHRVLVAAELVLYVSLRNGRLLESDSAYAQPMLIQGANTLSSGQDYTSDGPLTSAIAYALASFSPSNPDLIPLFCGVIGTFKLVAADSTGTPAHCLSST